MNLWQKYLFRVTNRENVEKRTYLFWGISNGLLAVLWVTSAVRDYNSVGFSWYTAATIFLALMFAFICAARLCQYFQYETLKQSEDSLGGNNHE